MGCVHIICVVVVCMCCVVVLFCFFCVLFVCACVLVVCSLLFVSYMFVLCAIVVSSSVVLFIDIPCLFVLLFMGLCPSCFS